MNFYSVFPIRSSSAMGRYSSPFLGSALVVNSTMPEDGYTATNASLPSISAVSRMRDCWGVLADDLPEEIQLVEKFLQGVFPGDGFHFRLHILDDLDHIESGAGKGKPPEQFRNRQAVSQLVIDSHRSTESVRLENLDIAFLVHAPTLRSAFHRVLSSLCCAAIIPERTSSTVYPANSLLEFCWNRGFLFSSRHERCFKYSTNAPL